MIAIIIYDCEVFFFFYFHVNLWYNKACSLEELRYKRKLKFFQKTQELLLLCIPISIHLILQVMSLWNSRELSMKMLGGKNTFMWDPSSLYFQKYWNRHKIHFWCGEVSSFIEWVTELVWNSKKVMLSNFSVTKMKYFIYFAPEKKIAHLFFDFKNTSKMYFFFGENIFQQGAGKQHRLIQANLQAQQFIWAE